MSHSASTGRGQALIARLAQAVSGSERPGATRAPTARGARPKVPIGQSMRHLANRQLRRLICLQCPKLLVGRLPLRRPW